ncbi:Avirulence protein (Avh) [Phytophthora palmivora]|uniref:RxLR effector protein n=1 Tax=Phytophthora palmivora TaxID=4796 RepID=A0A2P4Y9B0_9STRA|nr:Avirulence protein (Avh) [Phytophthora palmivora]
MRCSCTVLTALLTFIVNTTIIQALDQIQGNNIQKTSVHNQELFYRDDKKAAPSTRFLRVYDVASVNSAAIEDSADAQERVSLATLAKFKLTFVPSTKKLLKDGKSPAVVFEKYKLSNTVVNLDKNPALVKWFRYIQQYRAQLDDFPDDEMYAILAKTSSDKDMVALIQSLKNRPEFENLVDGMQKAMFTKWSESKIDTSVAFELLNIQRVDDKLAGNPGIKEWFSYVQMVRPTTTIKNFERFDDNIAKFLRDKTMSDDDFIMLVLGFKDDRMRNALLSYWQGKGYRPERVAKILSMSKSVETGAKDQLAKDYGELFTRIDDLVRARYEGIVHRRPHTSATGR